MLEEESFNIQNFPNEILMHIFGYMKPKHLTKCREVCWRWKLVVDSLCTSEALWRGHCKKEFAEIYEIAYYKRNPELSWNSLYRSLFLWSKLQYATELRDEFASATYVRNEICDFRVLRHGQIGVLTREGIEYYDIKTLSRANQRTIPGSYLRYVENDNAILVLGFSGDLKVTRKTDPHGEINACFRGVQNFCVNNETLFYVTSSSAVYICDLSKEKLQSSLLVQMEDGIMSLGYKNGNINMLTFRRDIFSIVGKEKVYQCSLDDSPNLLDGLYQFNLFENFDWRIYFQWMFVLHRTLPDDAIRDIIVVKIYGDMVFVGSRYGVFRIYHSPFLNDKFDIFVTEPVKQYNFMERRYCQVVTDCPIIQIDVLEGENGHDVLVGMPKKIAVLKFSHNIENVSTVPEVEVVDYN